MNEIQLIALAASRGARIQWFQPDSKVWCASSVLNFLGTYQQRVNPDDHLCRFGPVSRALYAAAAKPPENLDAALPELLVSVESWNRDWYQYYDADRDTRSTFLLIMAEHLRQRGCSMPLLRANAEVIGSSGRTPGYRADLTGDE